MDDEAVKSNTHFEHTATATPSSSDVTQLEQGVEQMSLHSPVTAGPETGSPAPYSEGSAATGKSKKKKVSGAERRKRQKIKLAEGPRLPPELLCYILQMGSALVGTLSSRGRRDQLEERRKFLAGVSLVSKLFGSEAQRLLWDTLYLRNKQRAALFVSSSQKTVVTTQRIIGGWEGNDDSTIGEAIIHGPLARKVIEACTGVQYLELRMVFHLDPNLFYDASGLSSLTDLALCAPLSFLPRALNRQTSKRLPFRLHSLLLPLLLPTDLNSSPLFIDLLCATDVQASIEITEVAADMISNRDIRRLRRQYAEDAFPAPSQPLTITRLAISAPDHPATILPVLPILRQCKSLTTFSTDQIFPELFNAIPSQLSIMSWRSLRDNHDWSAELDMIRADYHCLSALQALLNLREEGDGTGTNWKQLEAECASRGVFLCSDRVEAVARFL